MKYLPAVIDHSQSAHGPLDPRQPLTDLRHILAQHAGGEALTERLASLTSDWRLYRTREDDGALRDFAHSARLEILRPLTGEEQGFPIITPSAQRELWGDLGTHAVRRHTQAVQNAAIAGFQGWLASAGIAPDGDQAEEAAARLERIKNEPDLVPLAGIMLGYWRAQDVFIGARDHTLCLSAKGIETLEGEISRAAQAGHLAQVDLAGQRVALMMITPDPDGLQGRVRRELERDMSPEDAQWLSARATLIEEAGAFRRALGEHAREGALKEIFAELYPDPIPLPEIVPMHEEPDPEPEI